MAILLNSHQLATAVTTSSLGMVITGTYIKLDPAMFPAGATFRFSCSVHAVSGIGNGTVKLRRKGTATDDATLYPSGFGTYTATFAAPPGAQEYVLYLGAPSSGSITITQASVEVLSADGGYEGSALLHDEEFVTSSSVAVEVDPGYWHFVSADFPSTGVQFKFRAWMRAAHYSTTAYAKLQQWNGSTWVDVATISTNATADTLIESGTITMGDGKYRVVLYRSGGYPVYISGAHVYFYATSNSPGTCLYRREADQSQVVYMHDSGQWSGETLYYRGIYTGTASGAVDVHLNGTISRTLSGTLESISAGAFSVASGTHTAPTAADGVYVRRTNTNATFDAGYVCLAQMGTAASDYDEVTDVDVTAEMLLDTMFKGEASTLAESAAGIAATPKWVFEGGTSEGVTSDAATDVRAEMTVSRAEDASASIGTGLSLMLEALRTLSGSPGVDPAAQSDVPTASAFDATGDAQSSSVADTLAEGSADAIATATMILSLAREGAFTASATSDVLPASVGDFLVSTALASASGQGHGYALTVPGAIALGTASALLASQDLALTSSLTLPSGATVTVADVLSAVSALLVTASSSASMAGATQILRSVGMDSATSLAIAGAVDALTGAALAATVDTLAGTGSESVGFTSLDAAAAAMPLLALSWDEAVTVAGAGSVFPSSIAEFLASSGLAVVAETTQSPTLTIQGALALSAASAVLSEYGLSLASTVSLAAGTTLAVSDVVAYLADGLLQSSAGVEMDGRAVLPLSVALPSSASVAVARAVDVFVASALAVASGVQCSMSIGVDAVATLMATGVVESDSVLSAVALVTASGIAGVSPVALREAFGALALPSGTAVSLTAASALVGAGAVEADAGYTLSSGWDGSVTAPVDGYADFTTSTGSIFAGTVQFAASGAMTVSHLATLAASLDLPAGSVYLLESLAVMSGDALLPSAASEALFAFAQAFPTATLTVAADATAHPDLAISAETTAAASAGSGPSGSVRIALSLSLPAIASLAASGRISVDLASTLTALAEAQSTGILTANEAIAAAALAIHEAAGDSGNVDDASVEVSSSQSQAVTVDIPGNTTQSSGAGVASVSALSGVGGASMPVAAEQSAGAAIEMAAGTTLASTSDVTGSALVERGGAIVLDVAAAQDQTSDTSGMTVSSGADAIAGQTATSVLVAQESGAVDAQSEVSPAGSVGVTTAAATDAVSSQSALASVLVSPDGSVTATGSLALAAVQQMHPGAVFTASTASLILAVLEASVSISFSANAGFSAVSIVTSIPCQRFVLRRRKTVFDVGRQVAYRQRRRVTNHQTERRECLYIESRRKLHFTL